MKAIVQDRYGSADVLELKDIDQPERRPPIRSPNGGQHENRLRGASEPV
jgi:hypothetical protein